MHKEKYLRKLNVEGLRKSEIRCLERGQAALLILDMQDWFLSPDSRAFVPSAPDLIPGLMDMAELFHSKNLPVVFTRHLNTPENAGTMGRWWREIITKENGLSRISEHFDTSRSAVVEKSQYDAFHKTGLQELLDKSNTTAVVITGVMTHLCCETTARSAFTRGYDVLVPVDCTATYNVQLHKATTLNLSHGFARPICRESVMEAVRNAY